MNIEKMIKEYPNIQLSVGAAELKEFARDIISEFIAEKNYQTGVDNSPETDRHLTAKQVSLRMNVTKASLWRWAKKGILVPVKIGGRIYYKESEIKKLMDE